MNFKSTLVLASLTVIIAACGPTEPTKPVEQETPKTGLSNIQVVETADGYSAWLVSEPSIPIVSINMAWKGGETSDPAGKDGATDLLAYMMNEGAGDLDSKAFATRMEELNMTFGCSSGNDWTECSMSTLSANFEEAMDLVRLGLTETRFDEEPYTRAVQETLINLRNAETSPGTLATRALYASIYPDHPYARYSTPETVQAVTVEDLKSQRNRIMTKDTLLVSVVGDISPDRLKAVMETTFAGLPETSDIVELEDVVLKAPVLDPVVQELPQPQSLVTFTAQGLKRDDPDFFAAYVANYILGGGGFSARLMDEIREKRGLTYGIYSSLSTQDHLGLWRGSAQTMNEKAGELIARTKAELYKMATEGPTEQELEDAISYLTGAYPLGFDSNSKIAGAMLSIRQEDLGIDYIATRNSKVEAVTLEDVKRVAAKYLHPDNFTFIAVGQPGGLDEIDAIYAEAIAPQTEPEQE